MPRTIENSEQHTNPLYASFEHDLTTPVSETELTRVAGIWEQWLDDLKYYRKHTDPEQIQAQGEWPIRTKYDAIQGLFVDIPPEQAIADLTTSYFDEQIMLHPARLRAMMELASTRFAPSVGKKIDALNGLDHTVVHSAIFGFEIIGTDRARRISLHPQSSTKKILCDGMWIYTANEFEQSADDNPGVTSMILLNSTPDSFSSFGASRQINMQGRAFIPMDGFYRDISHQTMAYTRAIEYSRKDPVLAGHPHEELIKRRAQKLLGITVKPDPDYAMRVLDEFAQKGLDPDSVRVYDARARTEDVVNTVRAIHRRAPKKTILAGNIMDVDDAKALEQSGADGVVVILGGGGICLSPTVAKFAVRNIQTVHEFANKGLNIPIIVDSGTGNTYVILVAAGASGFMKGQGVVNLEKPPLLMGHPEIDKRTGRVIYKTNYSGEAGGRNKSFGREDMLRRPLFREGIDASTVYNGKSVTTNIFELSQDASTAVLFTRAKDLEELRQHPSAYLYKMDESAMDVGAVHHDPDGSRY
ncbi:MAG: IMP dehydrogenase [Candidatus Roizmanbacteria bacterium]|nr:IMP dehydrogenase [Candidatus Roizmanbacteria bacterium]